MDSLFLACLLLGSTQAQLPANYISMTGAQKMDTVWNLLQAGKYTSSPLPRSDASSDPLFNSTFLQGAFDQSIEEMPPGREKLVGTNGITAKVEFKVYPNSSYTGMWKASASNMGILRFSSNTASNLVSYFAMKMFVDGNYSQNLHMLHDVIGWGIPVVDYFQWSLQTGTPEPLPADYTAGRYDQKLGDAFDACVAGLPGGPLHRPPNIWALGNVEQSQIDNAGVLASKPMAPWIVQVTANPAIRPVNITIATDDWRSVVTKAIPNNTLLYTVSAMRSPCDGYDDIGQIWTRSEFIASLYGDRIMRFGQPYLQWDYSVAAPGTYCYKDPKSLTTWPDAEANLMEAEAVGTAPGSVSLGNSAAAVNGTSPSAGVSRKKQL